MNGGKIMTCKHCGSSNVSVQVTEKVKTKHRGCLGWSIWLMLAVCTGGLILIIPALTNKKIKSKTESWAVCQDCGKKWKV